VKAKAKQTITTNWIGLGRIKSQECEDTNKIERDAIMGLNDKRKAFSFTVPKAELGGVKHISEV
jgi:hypothetical protein